MRNVDDTSLKAYHELLETGAISQLQQLAFNTIRQFYEANGYWPTTREAHAFLVLEKNHRMAQLKGPEYIRRRLSELVIDPDDNNPDLLRKGEQREQVYLVKKVDEIDSTKDAYPLIIDGYREEKKVRQSTDQISQSP